MNFPTELKFTREHEWVRKEGEITAVGITDYAQEKLGEILAIELPEVDSYVERDEPFGTIESAKGVFELISPVSGEVVNVNEDILDDIGIINSDPHDTGWMITLEMSDSEELDDLLDSREYHDFVLKEAESD